MAPARSGMNCVVGARRSRMPMCAHRDCGWTKPGGLHHFNTYVRTIAAALLGSSRPERSSTASTTSAQWLDFEDMLTASMALNDQQSAHSSVTSSASNCVVSEPTVIPDSLSLGCEGSGRFRGIKCIELWCQGQPLSRLAVNAWDMRGFGPVRQIATS